MSAKKRSVQNYMDSLIGDGRTRVSRWLRDLSKRLDPGQHDEELFDEVPDVLNPFIDVLRHALGDRTGKIRVSDAYLICGIEVGKASQDQIIRVGRAIRELGWERQRRRFRGELQYAYVKGTIEEREVALVVEYDPSPLATN